MPTVGIYFKVLFQLKVNNLFKQSSRVHKIICYDYIDSNN